MPMRRCTAVSILNCSNSALQMLSPQLPRLSHTMRCFALPSGYKGVSRPCLSLCIGLPDLVRSGRDRAACQHRCQATDPKKELPSSDGGEQDTFEGLTEEEDWVVPGTNMASLSKNTELGQAVDAACDELDHLGGLENDMLKQADDILKKFGYKAAVMQPGMGEGEGTDDGDEGSKE